LGANLLNLKPCIEVKDGKMSVVKKYRGNYAKCLASYVKDRLDGRDDLDHQTLFVTRTSVSADCLHAVEDALAQCADFIRSNGFKTIEYENTALAAQYVAGLNDPTVAAIASEQAAEFFGLDVLERNINSSRANTTKFAALSRSDFLPKSKSDVHSILLFTVRNEAGSLAKALDIIGLHGFNMRTLRSRPMKELLWQYYFYVEAEGDISGKIGEIMLSELAECCDKVKVVGRFSGETILFDEEEQ
jgi:prephenate dehydratase